jgi:SAM-dependent methyltransferase
MTVAFYGEDLAYTHFAGFGTIADQAADRLLDELGKAKNTNGVIVELGCGPGITAAKLIAAKYDVIGVDISQEMLDLAHVNAPRGQFTLGSWADFEIPPCDAVIAINEVLNYMDPGTTLKTIERTFGRVFKALWPGGIFMFDMAGPGRLPDHAEHTSTYVGDDWATIVTAVEDKKGVLTRDITTMRKVEGGIRISEEQHKQRLISSTKVQEMLRKAGFRVRLAQGYDGDRAFPGHSVFIARRP